MTDEMPFLPFAERGSVVDGAFRWRLGLRPLDLDDWILLGADAEGPDGWIEEKGRLCAEHHATVFAALDGIEAESREVADTLVAHLAARWPDRYVGGDLLDPTLHPLDAAARLVPEDLVLMIERDGQLVFGGGSVCFPNRWDLRSKLGLTMAEVHEPVPELNAQLETHVDRFLNRLTPAQSYWRLGWGVLDVADGYAPMDGTAAPRPASIEPDALFLRVERETLRRFPETRCVLFTIRTYVQPVMAAVATEADRVALAISLDAMSETIQDYKDLSTWRADLVSKLI